MLASSLLSYQDTTFDPCEDFVGYATAGWVKKNPLPKAKPIWGSFNEVQKNNQVSPRMIATRRDRRERRGTLTHRSSCSSISE